MGRLRLVAWPVGRGLLLGSGISLLLRHLSPRWQVVSLLLLCSVAFCFIAKMMRDMRQLEKKIKDDDLLFAAWEKLSLEEKYKRLERKREVG